MIGLNILTNSRMNTFKRCRREHFFRYELGLRVSADAKVLRIGKIFHEAIDVLRRAGIADAVAIINKWYNDYTYECAMLRAMVRAYYWRYAENNPDPSIQISRVIASELPFERELINPETGGTSKTWRLAGKLDAIVELVDSRIAEFETKTIGENPENDEYWLMLMMDPQVNIYWEAAEDMGYPISTVIYDVARRPLLEPQMRTPDDKIKLKKDGTPYANVRTVDETPAEYEERLVADMMERPAFYFRRKELVRLENNRAETSNEVWEIGKDIRQAQLSSRWWRAANTRTCRSCCYFDFCAGLRMIQPNEVPDGFEYVTDLHPELERTTNASTDSSSPTASESGQATAEAPAF